MNIGLVMPLPPPPPTVAVDPAFLAREAERLGFESFWATQHIVAPVHVESISRVFADGQVPGFTDPLIALARASAVTSTIKLGTSVLLVPEHHPVMLAKQVATLDWYSNGRFIMGVGAGWLKEEAEIMGADFEHRWTQAREAVQVMKTLWTNDIAEHHGHYYELPPVRLFPKPAQRPHPPIFLGGQAKNVLKRVVAWGDGWQPSFVTPEQVKEGRATLDSLAAEAGRDPASLHIAAYSDRPERARIDEYFDAGAIRVMVRLPTVTNEREAGEELERLAEEALR